MRTGDSPNPKPIERRVPDINELGPRIISLEDEVRLKYRELFNFCEIYGLLPKSILKTDEKDIVDAGIPTPEKTQELIALVRDYNNADKELQRLRDSQDEYEQYTSTPETIQ